MKVQKSKNKEKSTAQEIRRLGVIFEHTDKNIALLAEQYGDIKNTLNEHSQMLREHTRLFAVMMETIASMQENIEFIKHGMKRKIDVDEFAVLERRVAILEKRR
jgi:hypothetical protein